MKNYLKLTNFEVNRMMKFLLILMVVILTIQLAGVFASTSNYMSAVNDLLYEQGVNESEVTHQIGWYSFSMFTNSFYFGGPILMAVTAISLYMLLTWYREWYGKNTFIYRLLMLPTERINVFLSKLTSILLATLMLVAFQLILIPIEKQIATWIIPSEYFYEEVLVSIFGVSPFMNLIVPMNFDMVFLTYGVGVLFVAVLFTMILFERCFGIKGILIGLAFGALSLAAFLSPLLLNEFVFNYYLYDGEVLFITIAVGLVLLAASVALSHWMLSRKIRV